MPATASVPALLSRLAADGGRPRVTWYGAGGERVELSGAVLANWVAKTTNLLVEELDAGPGTGVQVDLPPHWRTLVWALAAWRTGATVAVGDAAAADVVVTDRPGEHAGDGLVAVALPALARRHDGPLPAGAIDAAAAVMTYGDVIGWAPDADPARPALRHDGGTVTHTDLVAWAGRGTDAPADARVLLHAAPDRSAGLVAFLRQALGVLSTGGSLVVLAPPVADELAADPDRHERLVRTERVTAGG